MCERLGFEFFNVKLIDDDSLDKLPVNKKLGYMANYGQANVGNDIFTLLKRFEFPDLFGMVLNYGTFKGLYLDGMKVSRDKITFCLGCNEGESYDVEVPLAGTNGKFQVKKGGMVFDTVEWTDGKVKSFDKADGDNSEFIIIAD